MNEQCLLRVFLGESNQSVAWERDIPKVCRDCVSAELDKPYVLRNMQDFGIADPSLEKISKLYRIGLEGKENLHERLMVIEKMGVWAVGSDKPRTYHSFHCAKPLPDRTIDMFRKKEVQDVIPDSDFL